MRWLISYLVELLFSARKNQITVNSLVVVYVVSQKWCNVRAHKINISVGTIDFRPTLTYQSLISWLGAAGFHLFSRCFWWSICLQKGKHSGVFSDDCSNAHDKYLFLVGWVVLCVFSPRLCECFALQSFHRKTGLLSSKETYWSSAQVACSGLRFLYRDDFGNIFKLYNLGFAKDNELFAKIRDNSEFRSCVKVEVAPGLSVLMSLTFSVDVKQHWTMLRHWSQFVPNVSTDIRGHEALLHHHRQFQIWLHFP